MHAHLQTHALTASSYIQNCLVDEPEQAEGNGSEINGPEKLGFESSFKNRSWLEL